MIIPAAVYEAMVAHALAETPLEACGLLAGRDGRAVRFIPCVNEARSPVFFTIAPGELLRHFRAMDSDGFALLAVFHSHPATEARPSPTDILHAHYPEAAYLILSLAGEEPRLGAFRIREGGVMPAEVTVEEGRRLHGEGR